MSSLGALFRPSSVAVIGASQGITATGAPKLGTAALKNLIEHGFSGAIHPVNPREPELFGRRAWPSVASIDGPVDLAIIVVPASACLDALRQCADKGIRAAIVM